MNLPDLPRVLKKREADITPRVLAWFRDNYPDCVALEIKVTNKGTIEPSRLKDHQRAALIAAGSSSGIIHKLTDASRTRQPFDAFMIKNRQSFVVACFKASRKTTCLAIDPKEWKGARIGCPCAFTFTV